MQIKTIKAATMKEALEKMKNELGPNATVLQTRKYKSGGIMGVGGKEMIEITAAVEDEDEPVPAPAQQPIPQPIQQPQPAPIQNRVVNNPAPQQIPQPIQQTQPQPQPIQQTQPQPIQQTQPAQQPQPQKPTVRPRPKISFKMPQKNPVPAQPQQPTQQIQQIQPQPQPRPIQQPIQQVQPQPTQQIQQPQPKKLAVQPKIQPRPQPIQQPQPQPQPIQTQPPIPQQMVENPVPLPEAVPEEKIERIEVTVNGAIQDDHIPDVTELSQEQNQNQAPDQNPDPEQDPDQDPDAFEDEEPEEVESVEQPQHLEPAESKPVENIVESKPEEKIEDKVETDSKPEEKIEDKVETDSKPEEKVEDKVETDFKPEEKIENKVETDSKPAEKIENKVETESKPEEKAETKSSDIQILKTSTPLKIPDADLIGSPLPSFKSLEKIPRPKPIPKNNLQIVAKSDEPSKSNEDQTDKKDQPVDSKSAESKPDEKIESKPAEKVEESSQDQKRIQELEKEIARMKSLLEQFMGVEEQKDQFISLQEALQNQDIDEEIIKEFEKSAKSGILEVDNRSDDAKQALSKFMSQILKFSQGIRLNKNGVRVVALIGPTGVGKTTTLAKIAAKFVLEKNANVALITADTYRISAVEQLKTYADILGLPLETVYTPMELARAIRKHSDKKLILIDTAGRSQFNRVQMRELQDFLKISPHIERHLVLSATTRPRDANDIIEKFSACMPNRLVVTKTDETSSTGSLLKLLRSKNIPLSYVTHGQSVPDDILPASAEVFADVLLGRIRNDDFDDQGI